jgi:hypothetical protein
MLNEAGRAATELDGDEVVEQAPTEAGVPDGATEGLRVTLAGEGSVAIGGDSVRFATRHAELLLYLLVLAGDDGLPRDDLIMALWPHVDPADGRPRLRTALWQIRRSLGVHAWRLERERGVVRILLDGVIIDAGPQPPVLGTTILMGWKFEAPPTLSERVA